MKCSSFAARLRIAKSNWSLGHVREVMMVFLRKHELDHSAREMFRVLKPGGVYSCSESAAGFTGRRQEPPRCVRGK